MPESQDPAGSAPLPDRAPQGPEAGRSPLPRRVDLTERLRKQAVACRSGGGQPTDPMWLAVLLEDAADAIGELRTGVAARQAVIVGLERRASGVSVPDAVSPRPRLAEVDPRILESRRVEEPAPPNSVCPAELVVEQGRAIRILCRHYGWVRTDWGTLVKHSAGSSRVSAVPEPEQSHASIPDLVEAPGTIAELAGIAARTIA